MKEFQIQKQFFDQVSSLLLSADNESLKNPSVVGAKNRNFKKPEHMFFGGAQPENRLIISLT